MRNQMPASILSVYLPHFLLEVRGTMEVKGKCVETSNIAALLASQHEISVYFYRTTCYRGCRNGAVGAGGGSPEVSVLQAS